MAQRVRGYAKKPPAPWGNRVGGVKAALAEAAELRALAFDRGPGLSQGRNNGDRSFSLTLDELEDLEYQFPESLVSVYRGLQGRCRDTCRALSLL
ncbi:MAG: hypothetical protein J0H26_14155 [Alphaproteobacteria bacterium]|nr:hypothetical protein [Alphaproteobacteria bacterium]